MIEKLFALLQWIIPFDIASFNVSVLGAENKLHVARVRGEDTYVSALSYIPFVSTAIILLRKNNSDFVLHHAKHALILTILLLLGVMLLGSFVRVVVEVVLISLIIFGTARALAGAKVYIPLVTQLSRLVEI